MSGKIAEGSIGSQVDSEFKCQKWLSLLLRGILKIQAPPLILKADPHFEKKIIVQLDDACRSEFDRQGHVDF